MRIMGHTTSKLVNIMTDDWGITYRVEKPHLTDDDAYDEDFAVSSLSAFARRVSAL